MSTIMKALDRLDKEKASGASERPLREEIAERHIAPPVPASSRRTIQIGVGAGLVGLMAGLLFALSGGPGGTPNAVQREASPTLSAVSAPHDSDRAIPVARPAAEERVAVIQAPEKASGESLQPQVDEIHEVQAAPSSVAASSARVAVIQPAEPVVPALAPRLSPERSAKASPTRMPEPVGAGTASKFVEPEGKVVEPEFTAPALASTPSVVAEQPSRKSSSPPQSAAPALARVEPAADPPPVSAAPAPASALRDVRVARTIWHPTPDRRYAFVQVSGQAGSLRVREGDLVGGLGVKTIEPWGVVFLDDGVEVQHRVGGRN